MRLWPPQSRSDAQRKASHASISSNTRCICALVSARRGTMLAERKGSKVYRHQLDERYPLKVRKCIIAFRVRLRPSSTNTRRFVKQQSLAYLIHSGANLWLLARER